MKLVATYTIAGNKVELAKEFDGMSVFKTTDDNIHYFIIDGRVVGSMEISLDNDGDFDIDFCREY